MKYFLRIFIGLSIIMLAMSVTALSCNKVGDDKNNSGNNAGGGNNGGGGGGGKVTTPSRCEQDSTKCLELELAAGKGTYVKIVSNTVYLNAKGLADRTSYGPSASASDVNREFGSRNADWIFSVKHPDDKITLIAVSLGNVTKDTIDFPDFGGSDCTNGTHHGSESLEEAFANRKDGEIPRGGTCAHLQFGGGAPDTMVFKSYLGTVFKNPNTTTHARGAMRCEVRISRTNTAGNPTHILDDTVFNRDDPKCELKVVNNAPNGDATLDKAIEIDDAWVASAGSTKEVELYALGINLDGKKMSDITTDLGRTFTAGESFDLLDANNQNVLRVAMKAWSNADIKKLLEKYPWRDLKFKVKIVTSTEFAKL